MSKYGIPAISDDDLELANQPAVGAATRLFVAVGGYNKVAKIEQDAPADGTLTKDQTFKPADTEGRDLQVALTAGLISSVAAILSLNVTLPKINITGVSSATPGVITTAVPHGLMTGDTVDIAGVTGVGATGVNGTALPVTKISATTYSVGVATTGAGTGGTAIGHSSATATFAPPEQVTDQSYNLPQGLAVDLIPDGGAVQIHSVDSIKTVTGGSSGARYQVVALPDADQYIEVAGAKDKSPGIPSEEDVTIPDGYDPAAWTVRGRSSQPELKVSGPYRGMTEGLARLNGQLCCVKTETRVDGRILRERLVMAGARGKVVIEQGDGNAEQTVTFTARYQTFLAFC